MQLPASKVSVVDVSDPHLLIPPTVRSVTLGSETYSDNSLPMTAAIVTEELVSDTSPSPSISVPPRDGKLPSLLHVLIVDDSALNRRILRSSLQLDGGYTCEEAVDGLEAVSRIMTDVHNIEAGLHVNFDVVLMDNQMPRMNGIQATEELRRCGYQGVIIGVTGEDDDETRQQFKSAGANECLTKPVSHDMLANTIVTHHRSIKSLSSIPTHSFSANAKT